MPLRRFGAVGRLGPEQRAQPWR